MEKYFYLEGKEQKGPFTIEELASQKLKMDTLVWTENLGVWKNLKDIPELVQIINPQAPLKSDNQEKIKSFLKNPTWLIVWIGFHSFALLMTYTGIDFFMRGSSNTSEFWPFVSFRECFYYIRGGRNCRFTGIFTDYDWTEFAFYIGVAVLIYLLVRISKK